MAVAKRFEPIFNQLFFLKNGSRCESHASRSDDVSDAKSWACTLINAGDQTPLHGDLAEFLCDAAVIERRPPPEPALLVVERLDVFMKRPCLQIAK